MRDRSTESPTLKFELLSQQFTFLFVNSIFVDTARSCLRMHQLAEIVPDSLRMLAVGAR